MDSAKCQILSNTIFFKFLLSAISVHVNYGVFMGRKRLWLRLIKMQTFVTEGELQLHESLLYYMPIHHPDLYTFDVY